MSRIIIHFGHYGSGKTELALERAFLMAENGEKVTLVDLDIVNPYFRSGEQKKQLQEKGIKVITPNYEGSTVAVPSIPGEINSVFDNKSRSIIFDIGGSPSGAAAIGRYKHKLDNDDYMSYLVVNANRPFTTTPKDIIDMAHEIEDKTRIKIKAIINNTNAAYETTAQMVEDSQKIVEKAAEMMGVEIDAIYVLEKVKKELSETFKSKYNDKIKTVKLRMRPEWLDMESVIE